MSKRWILMGIIMSVFMLSGCEPAPCEKCNDEQVVMCETCNGSQKINCGNCGGDSIEHCINCGGTGLEFSQCGICKGKGKVVNPFTWEKFTCEMCAGEGAGKFACKKCNGSGNSSWQCTVCDSGKVGCHVCYEMGTIPCSLCNEEEYNVIMSEAKEKKEKYDEAIQLVNDYKYDEALVIFNELGDYRDCVAKVNQLKENTDKMKYNSEFELEGDWESVSEEETYFFSEEYGKEDEKLRITKEADDYYKISYIYDDGSVSSSVFINITIKENEFVFDTMEKELSDDDIKVYFLENGHLIFEKYHIGEDTPWQIFEAQRIN